MHDSCTEWNSSSIHTTGSVQHTFLLFLSTPPSSMQQQQHHPIGISINNNSIQFEIKQLFYILKTKTDRNKKGKQ